MQIIEYGNPEEPLAEPTIAFEVRVPREYATDFVRHLGAWAAVRPMESALMPPKELETAQERYREDMVTVMTDSRSGVAVPVITTENLRAAANGSDIAARLANKLFFIAATALPGDAEYTAIANYFLFAEGSSELQVRKPLGILASKSSELALLLSSTNIRQLGKTSNDFYADFDRRLRDENE